MVGKHIEFGGHSEDDSLFERGFVRMRVRIDQPWEQRMPCPVDYFRPVRRRERFSDRFDLAEIVPPTSRCCTNLSV
jgi:hypothetical protein